MCHIIAPDIIGQGEGDVALGYAYNVSYTYHLTGLFMALAMLLTWVGLFAQLRQISRRKALYRQDSQDVNRPTAILSVNQFVSSFLAFFAFFIYGTAVVPFNHYLVWTRLGATLLTLGVLWEIFHDRRNRTAASAFFGCSVLFVLISSLSLLQPGLREVVRTFSEVLTVLITCIMFQGYWHQVVLLHRRQEIGAVSWRLHTAFLVKDLATVSFGVVMGFKDGWPLMLMCGVSAVTKGVILAQIVLIRRAASRRSSSL